MKNYKDVADEVFSRSKEIEAENRLRHRRITEIGVSAACWAAAGAVGIGIWKTNIAGKDIVTSAPIQGAGSAVPGGVTIPPNDRNDSAGEETSKPAIYPPLDEKDVDPRCYVIRSHPAYILKSFKAHGYETEEEKFKAPENGEVILSKPLKEAMADYGKIDENGVDVLYDVIIEYYKDGKRVDPTKELYESEVERFGNSFYFMTDDSSETNHYTGAESASFDLLENIAPNEEYGYVIILKDNFFKDTDTSAYDVFYSSSITREPDNEEIPDIGVEPIRGHISNIDTKYEEKEYSPDNGKFVIGESLKAALEKYGREDKNGEIYYKVLVEYYKDGERINSTKELWESEHARGAGLNFASSGEDFGKNWEHYIWKHMTANEIESFRPGEEYGYALHLYNACLGYPFELMDNIINGYYNNGVYFE